MIENNNYNVIDDLQSRYQELDDAMQSCKAKDQIVNEKISLLNGKLEKLKQIEGSVKNKKLSKEIIKINNNINKLNKNKQKISNIFDKLHTKHTEFTSKLNENYYTQTFFSKIKNAFFQNNLEENLNIDINNQLNNVKKFEDLSDELIKSIEKESELADSLISTEHIDIDTNSDIVEGIKDDINELKIKIKEEIISLEEKIKKLEELREKRVTKNIFTSFLFWFRNYRRTEERIRLITYRLNYHIKELEKLEKQVLIDYSTEEIIDFSTMKNLNNAKKIIEMINKKSKIHIKNATNIAKRFEFIVSLENCKNKPNKENRNQLNKIIDELNENYQHLIPDLFENQEIRNSVIELLPKLGRDTKQLRFSSLAMFDPSLQNKMKNEIINNPLNWAQWEYYDTNIEIFNNHKLKLINDHRQNIVSQARKTRDSILESIKLIDEERIKIIDEFEFSKSKNIKINFELSEKLSVRMRSLRNEKNIRMKQMDCILALLKYKDEQNQENHDKVVKIMDEINKNDEPNLMTDHFHDEIVELSEVIFKTDKEILLRGILSTSKTVSALKAFFKSEWAFIQSIKRGQSKNDLGYSNNAIKKEEYDLLKISDEKLKQVQIFEAVFGEVGIDDAPPIDMPVTQRELSALFSLLEDRRTTPAYYICHGDGIISFV